MRHARSSSEVIALTQGIGEDGRSGFGCGEAAEGVRYQVRVVRGEVQALVVVLRCAHLQADARHSSAGRLS